jgi:NADH:ubiquinone reductase (H+-translocating)
VSEISTGRRCAVLRDGETLAYDYLVLAAGAVDQYFGHSGWAALAPGLKSIDDALEIRRRFLLAFEAAERQGDPTARQALLTTVIVGAGPTGVELAGAMAEMAHHSLARDFRRTDPTRARIVLVEGEERVLPPFSPRLSERAEAALRERGVEVRTGSPVSDIRPDAVDLRSETIATRNVVWAAGVAASPLGAELGVPIDRMGRVVVAPDLSIPGDPTVFVAGDLAMLEDRSGQPLPGLAPVAMQQGRAAGRNIARRLRGEPTQPFRYRDRGTMATIGRGAAVAEIGPLKLWGSPAWLAWIFVHIYFLIGFRNRIAVMLGWAWSYLTWQRGARLITGPVGASLGPPGAPLGEARDREPRAREDALEVTRRARAHGSAAGEPPGPERR